MSLLVMGPGRSGSHFLANTVRTMGFETIHEDTGKWRKGKHIEDCDWEGAADWLKGGKRALCGFPYGLMVHYLRHRIKDLPVICVHRSYEEWYKSAGGTPTVKDATSYPRGLKDKHHY